MSWGVGAAVCVVFLFRFVPLPGTPLMLIRATQGHGIDKDWEALSTLPPHIPRAIVAAEDQRFCSHRGIDTKQMSKAIGAWRNGKKLRGASTLSMQTTKNVFLWPDRSWVRKGLELPMTPVLELAWGKARILEVYLNVAELGPGVYGVQAAAQHHFKVDAVDLTRLQASLLAATLPNPLERSAGNPSAYVRKRAYQIRADIDVVDLDCVIVP